MTVAVGTANRILSLAGEWHFSLDPESRGIDDAWFIRELADVIELPGTTDERCKGPRSQERETLRLTRVHPYVGPAFYQRIVDISEDWKGKHVCFCVERTKSSMVWIDDQLIGQRDSLCTAHRYDVTKELTLGKHRLTVRVDNADLPPVGDGHQVSEHTQTNWNGLLGKIELQIRDPIHIEDLQAYQDVAQKQIRLDLRFTAACAGRLDASATAENSDLPHTVQQSFENVVTDDGGHAEIAIVLGDDMQCWDEFSPALYRIRVSFQNSAGSDTQEIVVGMRDFAAENGQFHVNGHATFLRGKHDACVFPLTGYAPMDAEEWRRIFTTAKSYGINHYRFHSWCPPRAAFEAADEVGIYMQPELPCWEFLGACDIDPMGDVEFRASGDDSVLETRMRYLTCEGIRILREFGNHPSFCMFALGNELGGDPDMMASLVRRFRREDSRHLYAHGSNNFIREPKRGVADDYWTTMMTGGHYRAGDFKPDSEGREVRGSFCVHTHGHVNNRPPGTCTDYSRALQDVDVPVIGHEVGQYQVFPNFEEITKYTGVLRARNFEVFREALGKAGMFDLAEDFFRASGALSVLCYREDIEAALRTRGFGGFQLLDLQDFPGQGTALVGVLDAFMESKGLITPEAWREFCNAVVVLARFDKYTWTRGERFVADLCIANYGPASFSDTPLNWSLETLGEEILASGQVQSPGDGAGIIPYGSISVLLDLEKCPQRLELNVALEGTGYRNRYPLWVYESTVDVSAWEDSIHVTERLDEATMASLRSGGSVLLCPDRDHVTRSVPGAFQSDFWCYPMFKKYNPPGTMGILCDPEHPALREFPTDFHSNWQWWRLLRNGCAMILDDFPQDLDPVVRVIDNVDRNHRLGVLVECAVGSGRLLVCTCNLLQQQQHPEARQLLVSLLAYMASDAFAPECSLCPESISSMFQ